MQRGKIARNVVTLVDPPAVKRSTAALPLTVDEARRVLQAAEQGRDSARWTVALAVGGERPGSRVELRGLEPLTPTLPA